MPSVVTRKSRYIRNIVLAGGIASGLATSDPAVFLVQLSGRIPAGFRAKIGKLLADSPVTGAQALGAHMTGKSQTLISIANRLEQTIPKNNLSIRLAWEVLANAQLIDVTNPHITAVTRARALWSAGQVDAAVDAAKSSGSRRLAQKFRAEAQLLETSWSITVSPKTNRPFADASPSQPGRGALHLLTNSLPHTQSGYTLRTQRLLQSLWEAGTFVQAVTRLGYPVSVGMIRALDTVQAGSITYKRILPWRLASTQTDRLTQWAQAVADDPKLQKPALIHTTTHFHNALVAQALAKYWQIPWVYEVRGVLEETWLSKQAPQQQAAGRDSQRFVRTRLRENQLMQAADHLVTLSETMKTSLVERGVPAEKITVVPNAVDDSLFDMNLTPQQARTRLELDTAGFWVGSVSSLVPYEGFDTLLRAVKIVRELGHDVRVALAGDGTDRVRLQELAFDLGIADSVVFLGKVTPERAYLVHQALDAFIVPRTRDIVCQTVTPLKPIEAMALNRPVIVSDVAPLIELVHQQVTGPTGLVAEAENAQSFADAILELSSAPEEAREYACAGREFAQTRTWARNAEIVRGIYKAIGCRDEELS